LKALTPAEIVEVADGLLKGFNQQYQLARLIATAANIDLVLDISTGHPLREMAGDIIKLTEAQGTTELVLREAAFQRPHNRFIQALAARFGLAPAPLSNVRVMVGGIAVEPADRDAYEAILLEKAGTIKPGAWRGDMVAREVAVCQILFRGDAIGTGFLVTPNRVISNWHVFEYPQSGAALGPLSEYAVRFDYRAAEGKAPASNGKIVAIDTASGYLAKSPKSELDYVLVQLTEKPGDDQLTADLKRGWLRPSSRTLQELEPVLVLQHPRGRTLELAIGPVVGWVDQRKDEIYAHWANTDEGSSGSPCFSCKWELVALHHRADPTGGKRPNRAIAMPAVLQDMGATGTLSLLPEVD
jgi:V8-like Glu-specific endopeptidase